MKKLELNVDLLAVQSFETAAEPQVQGTVHAADSTDVEVCDTFPTCPRRKTMFNSCVAYCECTDGFHACLGPRTFPC